MQNFDRGPPLNLDEGVPRNQGGYNFNRPGSNKGSYNDDFRQRGYDLPRMNMPLKNIIYFGYEDNHYIWNGRTKTNYDKIIPSFGNWRKFKKYIQNEFLAQEKKRARFKKVFDEEK